MSLGKTIVVAVLLALTWLPAYGGASGQPLDIGVSGLAAMLASTPIVRQADGSYSTALGPVYPLKNGNLLTPLGEIVNLGKGEYNTPLGIVKPDGKQGFLTMFGPVVRMKDGVYSTPFGIVRIVP